MSEKACFVTYTKEAMQYVTTPALEHYFLNWLNGAGGGSAGYVRETSNTVGIRCAPFRVHVTKKNDAVVLQLIKSEVKP